MVYGKWKEDMKKSRKLQERIEYNPEEPGKEVSRDNKLQTWKAISLTQNKSKNSEGSKRMSSRSIGISFIQKWEDCDHTANKFMLFSTRKTIRHSEKKPGIKTLCKYAASKYDMILSSWYNISTGGPFIQEQLDCGTFFGEAKWHFYTSFYSE